MGFPQTASGVGGNLHTQYGTATVENAAQACFVVGIPGVEFSVPRVTPDGFLSTNLVFDLVDVQEPVLALQFIFGTGPQVLRPVSWDSFISGTASWETAQQAIPVGFDAFSPGWSIFSPPGFLSTNLVFDLVDTQAAEIALHFTFGEGPRVLRPVPWDSQAFGISYVQSPQQAIVPGFESHRFGWLLVTPPGYLSSNLAFEFIDTQEAVLAIQFRFGDGASLIAPSGVPPVEFGLTEVENAADALYPVGIPPVEIGHPLVSDQSILVLDFDNARPPLHIPIQFYFGNPLDRQLRPLGWDSSELSPWTLVWIKPWFNVYPVGLNATQFGTVFSSRFIIYPNGWDSFQAGNNIPWREGEIQHIGHYSIGFGTPQLDIDNTIRPVGLDATRWGLIHYEYIPLVTQIIAPEGFECLAFEDEANPNETWVSNWWREVRLPDATPSVQIGDPFVDFRIRTLNVFQGINSLQAGAFQVGFHQDVNMVGRDHSVFGEHEAKIRRVYMQGLSSLLFGLPDDLRVSHGLGILSPRGFRPREFGEIRLWNRTQFVTFRPLCPEPGQRCGTDWGQLHFFRVFNRNRTVTPHGTVMTRFAFRAALVTNTGRAVLVKSFDPENFAPWYERHLVSHYIRNLPMPGLDSLRTVTHHRVRNAARALYPIGFVATQFGNLDKILWRWLLQNGRRHDEFSLPWVSRSPRYVNVFSNRAFLRFSHPFVDFGQRYIEPIGILPKSHNFLGPILTQKPIPTITPRWMRNENQFGSHTIKNNTPQLFVFGKSMFESIPRFNWVSHSPRYLGPQGWQTTIYGEPDRTFRDRTILMGSHVSSRVPQQFRVENKDPSPVIPGLQFVFMDDFCREDTQTRCALMGNPTVHTNVVYMEGTNFLKVGVPSTQSNGIKFSGQHQPNTLGWTEWGMASLNRPIRVYLGKFISESRGAEMGEEYGIPPNSEPPKCRVSPHTIWARLDTPQQAKDNHEESDDFCEVDRFCKEPVHPFGPSADRTGPWFGLIRVRPDPGPERDTVIRCLNTSFSPSTWACHRMFMRIGMDLRIENRNRVIPPDGWRTTLFGFPTVVTPFTRTVKVWGSANTDATYGNAVVTDNGPRFATNVSLGQTLQIGPFQIELFNREVYPAGLNATQWGNNNPMVHFPRTITPIDPDMTQYGVTWVSHSPRWVFMEGADMFQSWWVRFYDRMRVRPMLHYVRGYNFSIMSEWGQAQVLQAAPIISPYGIAAPCVNPHVTVEHG
jgi:hypothetical protein